MKIRVEVNNTTQMKTGVSIKIEDGVSLWIQFIYERLSNFCFQCGRLGHNQSMCKYPRPDYARVMDPRIAFRPWLRSQPSYQRDTRSLQREDQTQCQEENENSWRRTEIIYKIQSEKENQVLPRLSEMPNLVRKPLIEVFKTFIPTLLSAIQSN